MINKKSAYNQLLLSKNDTVAVMIDLQEKIFPAMHDWQDVEKKAATLIEGLRVLDIPIIATQQYTKGLGETTEKIKKAMCRDIAEIGILPLDESTHDDFSAFSHIEKMSFGAAGEPAFVKALENLGKNTVIVFGIESHVCVQQTVLQLIACGYSVFLAEDCVGSRSPMDMTCSLKRMTNAGATITTCESILFELLSGADQPNFKKISKLVK